MPSFRFFILAVSIGILLNNPVYATQLAITGDTVLNGGSYDANPQGVGVTDGIGLYIRDTNNSTPFNVITNGDISAQGNFKNGVYSRFGKIIIEGRPGANNTVNASYNANGSGGGDGIYAEDDLSSLSQNDTAITIKNMNVNASHNGQSGLFAANAGTLSIYGSNEVINKLTANNNLYGVISQYAGSLVDIHNMDVEVKNNTFYGIVSLNGVSDIRISGLPGANNKMVLENNGYGLAVFNTNPQIPGLSKFEVSMMDVFVKNNAFALIQDGTSMEFIKSNIYILDNSRGLEVGTSGIVKLSNTNFYTDHNLFYTALAGHSQMFADNGLLYGSILTSNIATNTSTIDFDKIRWNMLDDSRMTTLRLKDSVVDLRSKTPNTFTELVVKDYMSTGNNIIELNTVLGGDTSPTDKIIIETNGSVGGNTSLYIHGKPSTFGQTLEGIRVVEAQTGVTTSGNSFSLAGGVLDTGIHEYGLYKGTLSNLDTQSWFLRSTGRLTNTARTMTNIPAIAQEIAKSGMSYLNERMGELRLSATKNAGGAWARSYGKHTRINDKITTKMNIFGVEAGLDRKLDIDIDGNMYAGLVGGYTTANNINSNQDNATREASGDGYAPSLGLYAIWVGEDGWYTDAMVRNFWSTINMTNYSSTGLPIQYETKRSILMTSIEAGRKLEYKRDAHNSVTLELKLKVTAGKGNSDSFTTSTGYDIGYGNTNFLETKLAIDTGYKKHLDNGTIVEPYLHLGVLNEWRGKTDIDLFGVKQRSDLSGLGFEAGFGVNARFSDNTTMYFNAMYEKADLTKSFGGNLGIRYIF